MDAEESSDESDSELDEKGTDVYCKNNLLFNTFFKTALKRYNKNIRTQTISVHKFY